MFTFYTKREIIEVFTSSSCSNGKEIYKKLDALAELLFCQSKVIAFLPFSLMSLSPLLNLPIILYNRAR